MDKHDIEVLAGKINEGTATTADIIAYNRWLSETAGNYRENLTERKLAETGEEIKAMIWKGVERKPARIIRFRWAAAAAIVLLLSLTVFNLLKEKQPSVLVNRSPKNTISPEPAREGAILTLADGRQISLDSLPDGALPQELASGLYHENGRLVYKGADALANQVNTVSTPRARQFKLVLSDGTRVWLNAGSSVRYPMVFTGKERRVSVTGEVYLEVAHDSNHPFIVEKEEISVEVLGTHFNVNANDQQAGVLVSLLEGSIKVQSPLHAQTIAPGQQARVSTAGRIELFRDVNMEHVMGWKNGMFYFEQVDVETVLKEIARSYDVEIIYINRPSPEALHAGIPRNLPLADVLKLLELAGSARFKIEGNKILVSR